MQGHADKILIIVRDGGAEQARGTFRRYILIKLCIPGQCLERVHLVGELVEDQESEFDITRPAHNFGSRQYQIVYPRSVS